MPISPSRKWNFVRPLLRFGNQFACRSGKTVPQKCSASTKSNCFLTMAKKQVNSSQRKDAVFQAIDGSGYFLDFISDNGLKSPWCRLEAKYFIDQNLGLDNYIPIQVGPITNRREMSPGLEERQIIKIYGGESDEAIREMLSRIGVA